jgi:putative transposase
MHIVQRGNNRSRVFFEERDYWFYLHQLASLAPIAGCALHAYVLMPNHVHLLLTPNSSTGASILMKHLAQRHAQFVNRLRKRTGSLWEGRFYSTPVADSSYVLTCHRYIEMNPVRAGMVDHPKEYPWSSYRVNAEGVAADWMTPHQLVARLGQDPVQSRRAYERLFGLALDAVEVEQIRLSTRSGRALGSDPKSRVGV